MYIVHVHVKVKQERINEFIKATKINAGESIKEAGVERFDVIQRVDDPTSFILIEIYHTDKDSAAHKETRHYKIWREEVESMMAEPRHSVKFNNIFPDESE